MNPIFFVMKKNILLIALVSVFTVAHFSGNAQRRRSATLTVGGQVIQPRGEFAMQYSSHPAGFAANFTAPLGNSPLEVGLGFAWNNMGSQNKDINALVYTDSSGTNVYEAGTMRIRSTINRYQAIARFRPFVGRIQPYADAFAGVEAFKTKTDITIDSDGYSSATNSERAHLDMTYSFGWAAGLRFELTPSIYVEGRFENMTGGQVSFVDKSTIVVEDNNDITFSTTRSATNKYTYLLGITVAF